jgi:predicted transcriptional regulator/DNA-binding XRE family transcriptional regulator
MASSVVLGQRIRHFRTERGFTLEQLGNKLGVTASQMSLVETGKREAKLSFLTSLAEHLGVELAQLLDDAPPSKRAALENRWFQAERHPLYQSLGLPAPKINKSTSDDMLETLVGLYEEIFRREEQALATPEEARRANTELRYRMRSRNNHLPELEELAEDLVATSGHQTGAITHREVEMMAQSLGFDIVHVGDLPKTARSVTDMENGRIYLPPASIPGGHGLRSMALQAMAHQILKHPVPTTYEEFLQQRLEINYFAAACLMPKTQAVAFLQAAKNNRNIAVEDFRDAFGVTHEAASLRFTNLMTEFLDVRVHFLRVDDDGAILKAYENDGLSLPTDVTGATEGQIVCRTWSARQAFSRTNRTTEYYQYTDTPEGTFWESTQIGTGLEDEFSITVGVAFDDAKWFRGRDTTARFHSTCPDPECCRRPQAELREKWQGNAWASARLHAHALSPLQGGTFPGVGDVELFEFLERHEQPDQQEAK